MADILIDRDPSLITIKSEQHTLKIATIGLFEIPVSGVVPEPFTPTTNPWKILGRTHVGTGAVVPGAGFVVRVPGEAMAIPILTEAERDAIGTPVASMLIYNTTADQPEIFDGSAWRKLDQNFEPFQATLVPTGTTQTVDFATGRNQVIDLDSATGDVTLTLNNPVAGTVYTIKAIQGVVARDLIWPTAVLWPGGTPPVISIADNDLDVIQLFFDGTNYLGLFNQAFA